MLNNRQAGRRRGRGGQQQQRPQGGSGRPDNGNRIDNRARGNAAQLLEKYKTLARDAQMQGDRVNVEYYLQFADHYFRVLAETRARFEENGGAPSTRRIQGATLDEDEPEYEDEGERIEQPQGQQTGQQGEQGREQNRNDQNRGQNRDQQRGDQQRGGQNGYRQEGRQDRQDGRQDRDRNDGNRGYNQNRQDGGQNGNQQNGQYEPRGTGQDQRERVNGNAGGGAGGGAEGGYERQGDAPREDRPERQPRFERPRAEPRTEARPDLREDTEERVAEAPAPVEAAPEAPRRGRGRPRREVAPVVESGLEDVGFLAERLPASLNVSAVVTPEAANDGAVGTEGEVEKPRRRRGRPPASETTSVG